ncbi:224_t:CDS:2 [Acaulospora colombiana]|uniref:224_t:CDS:1 n=1 Tax=Acaulospora colombiana TaxID=27376 RepID=A0ACA9MSA7_9GLOM|nr:224_t:CDS:2 [Acaulospora colombiana]
MWAAYQGDAISVDIIIKHGAEVTLQDEKGMTALHWGVVKANKSVIRRLVEASPGLLQVRDETGKTPRELAQSLKSFIPFKKALEEGGLDEMGIPLKRPVLSDRNTKLAILILPTLCLGAIFKTFEILPWWTALPLAGAEFFGMHHVVSRVLLGAKHGTGEGGLTNSPYCAVGYFLTQPLDTPGYATANLAFALLFILCAYNLFRAITLDPGVCPLPASDEEKKLIIENLTSEGRLNGQTFCVSCMAQKPLRSKHCRHCDKCIGRHDQYSLPVGMELRGRGQPPTIPRLCHYACRRYHGVRLSGICMYVYPLFVWEIPTKCISLVFTLNTPFPPSGPPPTVPVYSFIRSLVGSDVPPAHAASHTGTPPPAEDPMGACILPDSLCAATQFDSFLTSLLFWTNLQLPWTFLLLGSQVWQVCRQMTTYEVSNLGRYGWMGGRGTSLQGQMGAVSALHAAGGTDAGADALPTTHTHRHAHGQGGVLSGGRMGFLMKLMGLDRFTQSKDREGLIKLGKTNSVKNPFDLGFRFVQVGVDYERLYEIPPEGFREAKRRRRERMEEEGLLNEDSGRKGFMRRMSMGGWTSVLGGRSQRDGYSPVRMDENV